MSTAPRHQYRRKRNRAESQENQTVAEAAKASSYAPDPFDFDVAPRDAAKATLKKVAIPKCILSDNDGTRTKKPRTAAQPHADSLQLGHGASQEGEGPGLLSKPKAHGDSSHFSSPSPVIQGSQQLQRRYGSRQQSDSSLATSQAGSDSTSKAGASQPSPRNASVISNDPLQSNSQPNPFLGSIFESDDDDSNDGTGGAPSGYSSDSGAHALRPSVRRQQERPKKLLRRVDSYSQPTEFDEDHFAFGEVKTAHEMKESGENRRINEDIAFLFDGIKDMCNVSMRRYSAFDLIRKLERPEFRKKVKVVQSLYPLLDVLADDKDELMMIAFLIAAYILITHSETAKTLLYDTNFVRFLSRRHFVDAIRGPPLERPHDKKSKAMHKDLLQLAKVAHTPLQLTEVLHVRLYWIAVVHEISSRAGELLVKGIPGAIPSMVWILDLKARTMADSAILEVLERVTFNSKDVRGLIVVESAFLDRLLTFIVTAFEELVKCTEANVQFEASGALMTALRLSINLTHDDVVICERLGRPSLLHTLSRMIVLPSKSDVHKMLVHGASTASSDSTIAQLGSQTEGIWAEQATERGDPHLIAVGLTVNICEQNATALDKLIMDYALQKGTDQWLPAALVRNLTVDQVHSCPSGAGQDVGSEGGISSGPLQLLSAVLLSLLLSRMPSSDQKLVRQAFPNKTLEPMLASLEQFVLMHREHNDDAFNDGATLSGVLDNYAQLLRTIRCIEEDQIACK